MIIKTENDIQTKRWDKYEKYIFRVTKKKVF